MRFRVPPSLMLTISFSAEFVNQSNPFSTVFLYFFQSCTQSPIPMAPLRSADSLSLASLFLPDILLTRGLGVAQICFVGWGWTEIIMEKSSEEENPPLLNGLFSDDRGSCNSSGEDSYSESDKEWRDAVKAAVESEIQYQVQLRLSLESPIRKDRKGEGTSNADSNVRIYRREKRVLGDKIDDQIDDQHLTNYVASTILQETATIEDATASAPQSDIKNLPNYIKHRQLQVVVDDKPEKKEPQTVYDYLHQKYGTSYEQLQNLMSTGKFRCNSGQECGIIGIDERIRWPTDCNITRPSPELASKNLQQRVPFFPDGPILGQARPLFHRTPQDCTIAFDRSTNTQAVDNSALIFDSRFESGNLRQAIKV